MGSLPTSTLPAAAIAVLLASILVPSALGHGALPVAAPTMGPTAAAGGPVLAAGGAPAPTGASSGLAAPFGRDPSHVLPDLPWETGGLVRSGSGTPWLPLVVSGQDVRGADDQQVRGSMSFGCPSGDQGTTVNDGTNTMTVRATCPFRIIDDADLMGSPQIAVNQNDPNSIAFFSLHGAGTTEGPSPRSRDPNPEGTGTLTGLSHTTFTSQDEGRSWYDNPWGTDGFGEHVTGVMDNDGNLYIGALWSKRLGDGQFDYVIKVYKEQDSRFEISNYQPSKTFANRAAGNAIEQANLVYVPAQSVFQVIDEDGNATGNATRPADEGDIGNFTNPDDHGFRNHPDDRIMLVWHEKARDWGNSTTGKSSWIDAAWTDTTTRDNWTRLETKQLIGPCMDASNPVSWNGKVYVACVADDGYRYRSRAKIGDIDIFSIDPRNGATRLEDKTNLRDGGDPKLTVRADGFMALTATRVVSENEVNVGLAFGWYGKLWEANPNIGGVLHSLASNTYTDPMPARPAPASNSVNEARITAMALTDDNPMDTLFLVYMERVNVGDVQDTNPTTQFVSPDSAIEYKKIVATFTKCEGPTHAYDLQLGVARHPFAEAIIGEETGVFDDLQDGMQFWEDPVSGQERIYFAYGDHGVIQYGWLVTSGSQPTLTCANPTPPPFTPASAIPAGLTSSSAASTVVGSAVGLTATAMVGYLLTVKRKSANALATKAKK